MTKKTIRKLRSAVDLPIDWNVIEQRSLEIQKRRAMAKGRASYRLAPPYGGASKAIPEQSAELDW